MPAAAEHFTPEWCLSRVSHDSESSCQLELQSHQIRLGLENSPQSWFAGFSKPQLLMGCQNRVPISHNIALSAGLLERHQDRAALFPQSVWFSRKGVQPRQKPRSFYNLMSEITLHWFNHILYTKVKSGGPAHIQGERITRAWMPEGGGFENRLPTTGPCFCHTLHISFSPRN